MACATAVRFRPSVQLGTSSAQAWRWAAQAVEPWSLRRPRVTIVMGLDQHRAQITAEWIDTVDRRDLRGRGCARRTGPVCASSLAASLARSSRSRWRRRRAGGSWSRSFSAVGARVHLAEPAETQRCAGARSAPRPTGRTRGICGELLMAGRLPESWIPPDHILDLRARVRLRHTLSDQRGEWQQRIQAVLYHHGCPQRGDLMTRRRRRVARALSRWPLPRASRSRSRSR